MGKNKLEKVLSLPISIIIAGAMLAGAWMYNTKVKIPENQQKINALSEKAQIQKSALEEKVLPTEGVELPVTWGDLGKKLVSSGVIDEEKFKTLYTSRGQFTENKEKLLLGDNNGKIKINEDNAGYILNLFWALGLSNANPILVDKVSRGIYRPCCGNSTHFPDCNHGMAMLGLLELMASQGASEQDMWKAALAVNSYWFPDTYLTIAAYMQNKGVAWKDVQPQEMLGNSYSSAQGYASIAAQIVQPQGQQGGGGCGVDAGVHQTQQQSGCAI